VVNVVSSDNSIWNKSEVIINIIKEATQSNTTISINLNNEGPCCDNVGLDLILDNVSSTFNILKSRYEITTANQLPSSKYKEKRIVNYILSGALQKAKTYTPSISSLNKTFGIFIGRSNWQRLGLASYLQDLYCDRSTITFHYDNESTFHLSNFGFDKLISKYPHTLDSVYRLLKTLPLTLDDVRYPILWSDNAYDLDHAYDDIFCEIICETYHSGKSFFITEKTYRCIINKRPFLIQGPKWFLKNLHLLGFKTFDRWWCEGYDQDHSDARYHTLTQHIDWISKQSDTIIQRWYDEMQPILDHNFEVLLNLTNNKIINTEFFYE